jgi:uncharacterized protein (TIGR02118 family)
MYAMIGTLRRPPGFTTEQFREWWIGEHVPHVLQIPSLRHYAICPADLAFDTSTGAFTSEPAYDGIAILWFDDEQAMRAAFTTAAGETDREHLHSVGLESVVIAGSPLVQKGAVVPA